MKEDAFWRNYFYRVGLIQQQFALKEIESGSGGGKPREKEDKKSRQQLVSSDHDSDAVAADIR